jgi:hypothetical protein
VQARLEMRRLVSIKDIFTTKPLYIYTGQLEKR